MEIGSKIKNLRLQKGLTQEELADRCELSKGFISLLESDKTSPSMATLEDILNAVGTDFAHFFREESGQRVVFGKDDFSVKQDQELKNEICWLIPTHRRMRWSRSLSLSNPAVRLIRIIPTRAKSSDMCWKAR